MLGHVFLVGEVLNSEQLMSGLLLCNVLRVVLLSRMARRHFNWVAAAGAATSLRAIQSLWFHTALNEVVQVLFRWVDKFTLNFLLPPALFALYFNGTLDVPFLPLLLGATGSALLLHFGQPSVPDAERVATLKQVGLVLGSLVFPLFFFLICFRYELFGVLFAHRYDAAVPLFVVSTLVVPLRAYNFTALLQHKSQGHIITKGAILDLLLALLLMYPLYRVLSLLGVALAFVISTYCQAGYYLAQTAKLLSVSWPELLPWKVWARQFSWAGLGILGLHELLIKLFPELVVMLTGSISAGLLGLYLFYQVKRRA
jgi:O-antigen/teichoic acid export membrane protein